MVTRWLRLLVVAASASVAWLGIPARAEDKQPQPQPARLEMTEYTWAQGNPAVKMIAKDEGFCYLSRVSGKFGGAGEEVKVYLADDGFWYLGGKSAQQGISASAIAVRFPTKVLLTVRRDAQVPPRWAKDLDALKSSADAEVRKMADAELKEMPAEPERQLAAAKAWLAAAARVGDARGAAESHALDLMRAAAGAMTDEAAADLRRQARDLSVAFCKRHLNDLSQWTRTDGEWQTDPAGRIIGRGNSSMTFKESLPADCEVSFIMNVLEGMRPRVSFGGTGLYVGTEGFEHVIEAHGAETQRGVKYVYLYDRPIPITVKLRGKAFELWVANELMAKGTRKDVPATMPLRLSAGDDFSKGSVAFSGFELRTPGDVPAVQKGVAP